MLDSDYRQAQIEHILQTLMTEGDFGFAVVSSKQGLPLAMVGPADIDIIGAVAAAMRDLAERAHRNVAEINTRDTLGNIIANRFFTLGEDFLLLSVQVPHGKPYRRLTNTAIRRIKHVWDA